MKKTETTVATPAPYWDESSFMQEMRELGHTMNRFFKEGQSNLIAPFVGQAINDLIDQLERHAYEVPVVSQIARAVFERLIIHQPKRLEEFREAMEASYEKVDGKMPSSVGRMLQAWEDILLKPLAEGVPLPESLTKPKPAKKATTLKSKAPTVSRKDRVVGAASKLSASKATGGMSAQLMTLVDNGALPVPAPAEVITLDKAA